MEWEDRGLLLYRPLTRREVIKIGGRQRERRGICKEGLVKPPPASSKHLVSNFSCLGSLPPGLTNQLSRFSEDMVGSLEEKIRHA